MSSISYFLIGAAIGAVSVWIYSSRKNKDSKRKNKLPEQEREEQEEDAFGLESFNEKRQEKIDGRKDKILEAIKKKGSVQTGEVSNMLGVSRNTAYRYLEELEEESRVEQTRESGRAVRYRLPR